MEYLLTSVSISSKIFINCSMVAFILLSSLQRASACKSLARKPCGRMTHHCKGSLRLVKTLSQSSHSPVHTPQQAGPDVRPTTSPLGKNREASPGPPQTLPIGCWPFYLTWHTEAANAPGCLALAKPLSPVYTHIQEAHTEEADVKSIGRC